MLKIEKTLGSFHAAHRLMNHKGECANLHGHSYKIAVSLESPSSWVSMEDHRMLLDFSCFGAFKSAIWLRFDHALIINQNDRITDHAVMSKVTKIVGDPTAENLSMIIWGMLKEIVVGMCQYPVMLTVRVNETETAFAEYKAECVG